MEKPLMPSALKHCFLGVFLTLTGSSDLFGQLGDLRTIAFPPFRFGSWETVPGDDARLIHVGFSNTTYTPFETLTNEMDSSSIQSLPVSDANEPAKTNDSTNANNARSGQRVDRNVSHTKFRIRTEIFYPQPNVGHAMHSYDNPGLVVGNLREQQIQEALNKIITSWDFVETPLRELIAEIKDSHPIPIHIDAAACEDAGLDLDTPVTKAISGISLRSGLRLLLDDFDLTYLVKNEVLLITTKDRAAENLLIMTYPVLAGDMDFQSLLCFIQNTVAPETWDCAGGLGTIQPLLMRNELAILQTREVHEELAAFFKNISEGEFSATGDKNSGGHSSVVTKIYPVFDRALLPDLEQRLFDICNTALGEIGRAHV